MSSKESPIDLTLALQDKPVLDALTEAVNLCENKKNRLLTTIEDIKNFKKEQKALYRAYYVAAEDLNDTVDGFKSDLVLYNCLKHFKSVDTSDIFFSDKKRKLT